MNPLRNILRRHPDDARRPAQIILNAPVSGTVIPLGQVNDPTFSDLILGEGLAVLPADGRIAAPADAVIEAVPHSRHAVSLTTDNGVSLLIHVGIDTVELDGRFFRVPVSPGDSVKAGDLLIEADLDGIRAAGYDTTTPIVVTNTDDYAAISPLSETASVNAPFLILEPRKSSAGR